MIVSLQFAPFNYLINTLLAKVQLTTLEPIIAGGFPLALFCTLKNIDSAEGWTHLYDEINRRHIRAISTAFGDIDCYFMTDNSIWQGEHRWLVADAGQREPEFPSQNIFGLTQPTPAHRLRWANNFVQCYQGNRVHYQFIKRPQTSVEACLDGFDLKICCIAWYNGRIFVHESFEDAFDRAEIQVNIHGFDKRSRDDAYARMFTALRAYKFAERLQFKLSDELRAFCSSLYAETRAIDLSSDGPLLDAQGQTTYNPVPSSPAFQGVVAHFWRRHEAYCGEDGRTTRLRRRRSIQPARQHW